MQLLALTTTVWILAILFILVCLFMMIVILVQRPKGGGLSGAFGGAGGNAQAAFGAKVGDVLTNVTIVCFIAFLVLAMGMTWATKPANDPTEPNVLEELVSDPAEAIEDASGTLPGEDFDQPVGEMPADETAPPVEELVEDPAPGVPVETAEPAPAVADETPADATP